MSFVGNLLGFPAVKELAIKNNDKVTYCHEFGVLLFWGHSVHYKLGTLYN